MSEHDTNLESILTSNVPDQTGAQAGVTESPSSPSPQPAPVAQAQPVPGQDGADDPQTVDQQGQQMVPRAALEAERGKRKKYTEEVEGFKKRLDETNSMWEQRFNQLYGVLQQSRQPQQPPQREQQPQQPPPDFFADPDVAIRYHIERALGPVAQQFMTHVEATSQQFALSKHGEETVNAAYDAIAQRLQSDPNTGHEYRRIMSSRDPWGELVKWYKKEQAAAAIGDDPAAYEKRIEERVRERVLAELAQQHQQQAQPVAQPAAQPAPVMPSNLVNARNAGTRSKGPAWAGPTPLGGIFRQ